MKRKSYSPEFKAKVAFEAAKGVMTANEISSKYEVHPVQVSQWKKELLENIGGIFEGKRKKIPAENQVEASKLYEEIGRLKIEVEWLKKNLSNYPKCDPKKLIDTNHPLISVRRQCELLGVCRSTIYYEPDSPANYLIKDKQLMDIIDLQYSQTPFYGTRRISEAISLQLGVPVNRKCTKRLMRKMGITAIYPKPNTSKSRKENMIYPYLLTGLTINRPNMMWATDITYVRLKHGFAYLVAVIDWYSRKVLSWRLSNTMDTSFCLETLEEAIQKQVAPEYFNTDQGAQFTSIEFTSVLKANGIKISMDGKGRAIDNVFTERLWRTIKYENIYIKGYETMSEARSGLEEYLKFYNSERIHSALQYKTPDMVYQGAEYVGHITVGKKALKRAA